MSDTPRKATLVNKPVTATKTLRSTNGLPEGAVNLSYGLGKDKKPRVYSVAITIPDRGDAVARTRALGDGAAVLEFDANGRFLGVELLSDLAKEAWDTWIKSLEGQPDAHLQRVALHTAIHIRHDLYYGMKVLLAAKVAPARAMETSTEEACPKTKTWDTELELATS